MATSGTNAGEDTFYIWCNCGAFHHKLYLQLMVEYVGQMQWCYSGASFTAVREMLVVTSASSLRLRLRSLGLLVEGAPVSAWPALLCTTLFSSSTIICNRTLHTVAFPASAPKADKPAIKHVCLRSSDLCQCCICSTRVAVMMQQDCRQQFTGATPSMSACLSMQQP